MRQAALGAVIRTVCILALAQCVACADRAVLRPVLSSRFYGIWANANPRLPSNWLIISTDGVVPYYLGEDGKCSTASTVVLGSNRVQVKEGELRLLRAEDLLVMALDDFRTVAFYKPVKVDAICRKADGTYAEGAPGIARSS